VELGHDGGTEFGASGVIASCTGHSKETWVKARARAGLSRAKALRYVLLDGLPSEPECHASSSWSVDLTN